MPNWSQNGYQICSKSMPKPSTYHQNVSKNRHKINEKSRLRRGYVFGATIVAKSGSATVTGEGHLATIFDQISTKMKSKKASKHRCRKKFEN